MDYKSRKTVFGKLGKTTKKRVIDKIESIQDDPFLYITKLIGYDTYKIRVED